MYSNESLKKLIEGNKRYVEGSLTCASHILARRAEVAKAQHPSAVVITCSDSRVSPELIFDQPPGNIFVVRNAGGVMDDVALGSVEYAVEHLGAHLILVLGHTGCGAVEAAVKGKTTPGRMHKIVEALRPAVIKAKGMPGDAVTNAVKVCVQQTVAKMDSLSAPLSRLSYDGRLNIVGAIYELDTGMVKLLQ